MDAEAKIRVEDTIMLANLSSVDDDTMKRCAEIRALDA
jgi:hypothetical protein